MIKLFCEHDNEHIATEKNYPSRMRLFGCDKSGQLFYVYKYEKPNVENQTPREIR